MSRSSSRLRGLGLAGLAALAALTAAPAVGATAVALEATCDFGFLPSRTVTVGLDVVDSVDSYGGPPVPLYTVTSMRGVPIFEPTSPSFTLDATLVPSSGPVKSLSTKLPTWGFPRGGALLPADVPSGSAQLQFTGLTINVDGAAPDSGSPATWDVPCTLPSPTPSATIQVDPGDRTPPYPPGPLNFEASGPGAVTVSWGASTDNVGVSKYVVSVAGQARTIEVAAPQTSTTITGLVPGQLLDVRVEAVDAAGNRSPLSIKQIRVGDGIILDGYGAPVDLRVARTSTTVTLSWGFNPWLEPPSIDVFQDGVKVKSVSGVRETTITGLTPGRGYTFAVAAMSGTLQLGAAPSIFVSLPSSSMITWPLAGSATVPTLAKGPIPLKGVLELDVDEAGAVTGNVAFLDTSVRLVAGGYLPIVAKVGFIPSGRTTGTYAAGVLKTTSKVRIKVIRVSMFGAIPLPIGNSCQTRKLTDLNLTSAAGFSLEAGGTLSGEFAMSDLNGCALLAGIVNPLTNSTGNTITLQATAPTPQAG